MPDMKQCSKCKETKLLSEFNLDRRKKGGLRSECKACVAIYSHMYRKTHKKKHSPHRPHQDSERGARYYQKHKDQVIARVVNHQKRTYDSARSVEKSRRRMAMKKFADTILARDGYVCHICSQPVARENLVFDHIIPVSRGGSTTLDNLKVSHVVCNARKGTKLMHELLDYDRRGPNVA